MHLAEFVEINVRSLDHFDFSNFDVLDWVNRTDFLGDLLLNNFTSEKVKDLSGVGLGDLFGNDFVDLSADDLLLRAQSVVGLALLVEGLSGKSNHEDPQDISVLRLDVRNGFNKSFSLLDEGAELISGGINTVETGDSLSAFGLVDDELDLPPVEGVLVGCKVSLHLRDHSALDAVLDLFCYKWRCY